MACFEGDLGIIILQRFVTEASNNDDEVKGDNDYFFSGYNT